MARANRPLALRLLLAGLICCCLAYLAAPAIPALAADGARLLKQGEEHYQFAEWDQARQTLDQALAAGGLSPTQRARAYFHLGLVAEAQGDAVAATARFRQAKAADPAWSPDPAQFPPNAVAHFNQAGPASSTTPAMTTPAPAAPAGPAPPVALPKPPPAPPAMAVTPAAPPAHAIREAELPPSAMPAPAPAPAVEPAAEPRFDQQDLIEQRRQARLTFVEGVDLFNAGRYAEAEQRFLAFLAVFPGDNQGEHFLALTRQTLAAQGGGNLRVTCRQPATVFLDGRPVGQTPLALDNLSVGRHQVEVRAGGNSQSQVVEIKGRTTTSIAFDLTRYEVPETPAPAAPAAPGAWRHPGLGFSIVPPPGWRVGDKPDDADLRLVPDQGQGFIQVNSTPSDRQLDPATYAELWGRNYQQMVQPGAQRLSSQARSLAGGPAEPAWQAWQSEFAGDDVRTVVVFVSRPQRMYVLTGAWAAVDHERRLPDFNAAVESFRAP